jgi:hypothetical protein
LPNNAAIAADTSSWAAGSSAAVDNPAARLASLSEDPIMAKSDAASDNHDGDTAKNDISGPFESAQFRLTHSTDGDRDRQLIRGGPERADLQQQTTTY